MNKVDTGKHNTKLKESKSNHVNWKHLSWKGRFDWTSDQLLVHKCQIKKWRSYAWKLGIHRNETLVNSISHLKSAFAHESQTILVYQL